MDHHRWPQGLGFSAAAIKSSASESSCISNPAAGERRARPNKERVLNCPRCNSGNTKFCYYNNYSLTQPRYFCKTCRRYWTEGGSLRNVPVGGGSRKNKRSSAAKAATPSSSASASAARSKYYGVQDLNLIGNGIPEDAYPNLELINGCSNGATAAVEILTGTGMTGGARLMPVTEYSPASFGTLQEEFRPAAALNFALDGGGKILFPSDDELKPPALGVLPSYLNLADRHQFDPAEQHKAAAHRGEPSLPPPPGFWNGLVHGGDGSW